MRRRECQRGWISGPPPLVSRETEPALQSLLCEAPGGPLLASAPHLSDRAMALCSLEGLCSLLLRGDRREEEGLGPNARCLGPGELKPLLTASRHPGDEHVLPEPDTSLLHTRST
ncbi:hypothetical protein Celaphus_00004914 [Cervus elaphus hippelaphus]|uniref:Uncharacterized protein n=1 Tax=Cervus elaphus hippelaphus TaxID=46360 RepID=A0A212DCA7_CEREH|nr:hypothetical protein Celaphus_00004914 [Cervus elaphus hippelaphus]